MSEDLNDKQDIADDSTLQGWVPEVDEPATLFDVLEKAFDYRGDVTLTTHDGQRVEGFVFDRRTGQGLDDSSVRLMLKKGGRTTVRYGDIAGIEFSGKDPTRGKSFERWVKKYVAKKLRGERATNEDEAHPGD